jgi:choline transport protein
VLGLRTPASKVFSDFQDNASWSSISLSFCTCLGDESAIEIVPNATQPITAITALASITIIMAVFGCVNIVATCSRQLFASSRNEGVPFSALFSHVRPGLNIPLNNVMASFGIAIRLFLINIGSTAAFNSVASYIISIFCTCLEHWRDEVLLPCKFSLGRAGVGSTVLSSSTGCVAPVFTFSPSSSHPTLGAMNWNALTYCVAVLCSLACYLFMKSKVHADSRSGLLLPVPRHKVKRFSSFLTLDTRWKFMDESKTTY